MLTPSEKRAAALMGIALRHSMEKDAGWLREGWNYASNAAKSLAGLIGGYANISGVIGAGAGLGGGALWFALDRARQNRTKKQMEKEQEIQFYRDYLQSVGEE